MLTTRQKLDYCPVCMNKLDAATSLSEEVPKPEDLTVCSFCLAILEFDKNMRLRTVSADVIERLPRGVKTKLEESHRAAIILRDLRSRKN